jgi:hypothetical protein
MGLVRDLRSVWPQLAEVMAGHHPSISPYIPHADGGDVVEVVYERAHVL